MRYSRRCFCNCTPDKAKASTPGPCSNVRYIRGSSLTAVYHRKLGDHTYLTWNNDHHGAATATGVSRPGNDAA